MAREHVLHREQVLPGSPERVFPFFSDAENLERITPPWLGFRIVSPRPVALREGALVTYRLRLFGVPFGWQTRIGVWDPPHRFVDEQLRGPYRLWHHTHAFRALPEAGNAGNGGGTLMTDTVRFALPFAPAGELALPVVRRQLERIFDFRRDAVLACLAEAEAEAAADEGVSPGEPPAPPGTAGPARPRSAPAPRGAPGTWAAR